MLDDPGAKRYLAGSAFHCYGGDVSAQSIVHAAHPDRGIWFTECSGGDWAPVFGDNLLWNTSTLVVNGTRNWAKGVLLWNLALDEQHSDQPLEVRDRSRAFSATVPARAVATYAWR